jgi:hypothetical protein
MACPKSIIRNSGQVLLQLRSRPLSAYRNITDRNRSLHTVKLMFMKAPLLLRLLSIAGATGCTRSQRGFNSSSITIQTAYQPCLLQNWLHTRQLESSKSVARVTVSFTALGLGMLAVRMTFTRQPFAGNRPSEAALSS